MPFGDEPIYTGTPMSKPETLVNGGAEAEPKADIPNQQKSAEEKVNGGGNNVNTIEIARAQLMAQLAADPEISKILQARQSGKKLQVVDPEELSSNSQAEEQVDWDSLSNKDLVQKIPAVLAPAFKQMLAEQTKPLLEQIQQLTVATQQSQAEKVNNSIQAAKQKFSDFETYRPQMAELNRKSPGLDVEELYWLAKAKAGDFNKPEPTNTERPTNVSARPSLREQRKAPLPPGKRGMAQLLDEALSNRDFAMIND